MHPDAIAVAVASSQPISYDTGSMLAHFSGCSHHRPANSQSISCDRTTVTTPTQVVGISEWALINDLFGDSHGNFENPRKIGASAGFFSSVGSGKTTPCQHIELCVGWASATRSTRSCSASAGLLCTTGSHARELPDQSGQAAVDRVDSPVGEVQPLSCSFACGRRMVNNARPLSALSLSRSLYLLTSECPATRAHSLTGVRRGVVAVAPARQIGYR